VALVYEEGDNPNGSVDNIAGICDASGLVFGLMPHPERHVSRLHHPAWSQREAEAADPPGLRIFANAVGYAATGVGKGV
jgi:phosphoribosylformylglycinamidine synthase